MKFKEVVRKLINFFWGVTNIGKFIRLCIYLGVIIGYSKDILDEVLGFYFISLVLISMGSFIHMAVQASRKEHILRPKPIPIKIHKGFIFKKRK